MFYEFVGRCICPSETYGPHCKVLYRHFSGTLSSTTYFEQDLKSTKGQKSSIDPFNPELQLESSILLPNLPSCSHIHINFWFLSLHPNGRLVAWGNGEQFTALQLRNGKIEVLVKTSSHRSTITNTVNGHNLDDNQWHRVDFWWKNQVRWL